MRHLAVLNFMAGVLVASAIVTLWQRPNLTGWALTFSLAGWALIVAVTTSLLQRGGR